MVLAFQATLTQESVGPVNLNYRPVALNDPEMVLERLVEVTLDGALKVYWTLI